MACSGPDSFQLLKTGWPQTPSVVEDDSHLLVLLHLSSAGITSADQYLWLRQCQRSNPGLCTHQTALSTLPYPQPQACFPSIPGNHKVPHYPFLLLSLVLTLHTPHSQGTLWGLYLPVFPGLGCSPEECQDVKSNPVIENVSSPHCLPPGSQSKLTSTRTSPECCPSHWCTAIHKPGIT